jgi:hypothetical protein
VGLHSVGKCVSIDCDGLLLEPRCKAIVSFIEVEFDVAIEKNSSTELFFWISFGHLKVFV